MVMIVRNQERNEDSSSEKEKKMKNAKREIDVANEMNR